MNTVCWFRTHLCFKQLNDEPLETISFSCISLIKIVVKANIKIACVRLEINYSISFFLIHKDCGCASDWWGLIIQKCGTHGDSNANLTTVKRDWKIKDVLAGNVCFCLDEDNFKGSKHAYFSIKTSTWTVYCIQSIHLNHSSLESKCQHHRSDQICTHYNP